MAKIRKVPHDQFEETYFGPWNIAVKETLNDYAAHASISEVIKIPKLSLTGIVRKFHNELRDYAVDWNMISNTHKERGVYRDIVGFIGRQEGLLIDLGCGNGNFIAEYGQVPAIGVDLNGYSLQLAEKNLKENVFPLKRYSASTLSFNSKKGFDIRPLEGELCLDGVTLLCDDIYNLEMTKKVLRDKDMRADIVTFMLFGGRNAYEAIHFLDSNPGSFDYKSAARVTKYKIMEQLPDILKPGGKFYVGIRVDPSTEEILSKKGMNIEGMFEDLAQKRGELKRFVSIPLPYEKGNIIGISNIFGKFESDTSLGLAEIVLK